ncbi:tRNA wybutosine-synthesizing protein 5-like [Cimex lectularius]|uniref:JmjC domain-containing protein n=1 Tax=Cimex lectularius TaxID=79782 RepID=A0A8I6SHG3_CIMLE|nr:tRNA wybutosine-synthesizing protein 5-like [Cimex lectularius]XP_024081725.1 tRNA wybutosine-synthesizing protein 5-like [Cimex lectularius]XP_024081726.1 tRNA wybutosine-synthesizing protein 5-like [Cimex lectularius]XP_024081727.1 tRNA wybutosine-synthesizing protein 5-like [Cimex lectularius]
MSIEIKPVEIYDYVSKDHFQQFIANERRPLLIKNIDIGDCIKKWTVDYLAEALGENEVKVHVSPVGNMSFINKNFTYKTLRFDEFIRRAAAEKNTKWFLCENERYYLRSTGSDRRGKDVANVEKQFPQISRDIKYPELFDKSDFFSSVFRIGSCGVQIWTHYDIMDNILLQISGEKRVVLFSPHDTQHMYLNGDKSEVLDIDCPNVEKFPNFVKATQYECIMKPGDVLYIPALWHHNTTAKTFGIGVNVFWKNLPHELYDKTDVYGNKDLLPAAKALSDINKALKIFKTLPAMYKDFYIQRAISALEKARES